MFAKFHTLLLALTLLVPAARSGAQEFDGLYQPSFLSGMNWSCLPSQIGMDGGAVAIQGNILYGVESQCTLSNPRPNSELGGVQYSADCNSEGEVSREEILIVHAQNGVSIIRNGHAMNWRTCQTAHIWEFGPKGAQISANGVSLYLGCDRDAQPIAWLIGYATADAIPVSFSIDGGPPEIFNFSRVGPSGTMYSSLYAENFWDGGIVESLASGSSLRISDGQHSPATLPLSGSRAAIDTLWQRCNLAGQAVSY